MEDTQLLECTQAIIDQTNDTDEQRLIGWLEIEEIKYEICEGTFKIGRDPATCDILLQNQKTISKEHAIIEAESAGIFLMDLGSRNKTRLGKVAIKPLVRYALQGGEHLQFGIVKALFSKNIESIENEEGNSSDDSESMLTSGDFVPSPNKSYVNQSSDVSVISPTPQVSSKFCQSKILEGKKSSSGFVPETPRITKGDEQWNFSNVIRESPSSQSTPFPTNLRSSLKNFTSPAFLSPIAQNHSLDDTSESDGLASKSKKSVSFKFSYSGEEEIKEDISSDESTDIEEFFNIDNNIKCNSIKRQRFALNSKCNEDIFNMATQPHSVESEKQLHVDISNADANTQEVLLAFTKNRGLKEADNTQEILSAFEQPTQLGTNSVKSNSPDSQIFQNLKAHGKTFKHTSIGSSKSKGTIASVRKDEIEEDIHEVATQVFLEHGSGNKDSSSLNCHNEEENSDIFDMPTEPLMKTNKFFKGKTSPINIDSESTVYDIHDAPTQAFPSPQKHESSVQICLAAGTTREVDKNNVDFLNVNDLVPKKSEKIFNEQGNPNNCKVNDNDDTDSNLKSDIMPTNDDFESTLPPTQVFSKSHLISPNQETDEMNCSLPPTQVFSRLQFQNNTGTKSMETPLDLNNTQLFSQFEAPDKGARDLDQTQVFCSQNVVNIVAQDLCDSNSNLPATQIFSPSHLHENVTLTSDPNCSLPATQLFSHTHLECKDHDDPNMSLPPTQIFSPSRLQGNDQDDSNCSLPPTQIFSLSHLQGKGHNDLNCSDAKSSVYDIHDAPTQTFPSPQKHESSVQICLAAGTSKEVDKNNVDFLNVNDLVPEKREKIYNEQDNPNVCKVNDKDDTDSNLKSDIMPTNEDFESALPPTQVFSKSHLISPNQETEEMNCSLPPTQVFSRLQFQNNTGTKSMETPLDLNNTQLFSQFEAPDMGAEDLDQTQVFCSQNVVNIVAQDLCDSNSNLPATQIFSPSHLHENVTLTSDPNCSLPATQLFSYTHLECKDHDDPNMSLPPTQIFSLSHLQEKDPDDACNSLPPTQIFSPLHLQGNDHDDSNCSLPPTQIFSLSHLQGKDHDDLNCNLPLTQVFSSDILIGNSSNRNEFNANTDSDNSSCSSETLLTTANKPPETASLQNLADNCSTVSLTSGNSLGLNINDSVNSLQQRKDIKTGYNSDESTEIEYTEHLNHPSKEISTELLADFANCSNSLVNKNISEVPKHELKKSDCGHHPDESTNVENNLNPSNSIPCAKDRLQNYGTLDNTLKVSTSVTKSNLKEKKLISVFDNDSCGYNSDESTDIEDELILSRCKSHTPKVTNSAKCSPNIKQLKENASPDTSLDMTDTPSELYPNLVIVVPTQLSEFMTANPKSPFNGSNDSQQSPYRIAHGDNQPDKSPSMADSDDDDNTMDKSQELFNLNSPCAAFTLYSKSPGKGSGNSLTSTPANNKKSLSCFIGSKGNSPMSFVGFNNDDQNVTKSSVMNGSQPGTPTLSHCVIENDTAIVLGEKNAKEIRYRKSNIICKRKLIVPDSPNCKSSSSNNLSTSHNNYSNECILSSKDSKISPDNICSVIGSSKVLKNLLRDKMSEQPTSREANFSRNLRQPKVQNLQTAKTKVNKICGKGFLIENTKSSNRDSNFCGQTTRNGRRSIAPARYSPDRSSCSLKNDTLQKEQSKSQNKRTCNAIQKETTCVVTKNNEVLESNLIVHSLNKDLNSKMKNSSTNKQKGKSCTGNNSSTSGIEENNEQIHLIETTLNDNLNTNNLKIMPNKDTLLHKPNQETEEEVVKMGVSVTKNNNSYDHAIPLITRTCKVRKRKALFDYETDVSNPKQNANKNTKESHSDELLTSGSINSVELPNRDIDQILNSPEGNISTAAHIKPGYRKLTGTEDLSVRVDVNDKFCFSEHNLVNTNHSERLTSSTMNNVIPNKNVILNTNVIKDIETDNKGDCHKNSVKLNKSCQQKPPNKGIRKRGRPKKSLLFNAVEQKNEDQYVISEPELPTIDAAMKNSSIKDVNCSNNVAYDEKSRPLLRCSQTICNKSLARNETSKKIMTQDMSLFSHNDNSNTKISTSVDVAIKDTEDNGVCYNFMKSTRNSCHGAVEKISVASNENDLIPKNSKYLLKNKHSDAYSTGNENQNETLTRRTRNSCKVKPSIGSGFNKRILSPDSRMIDAKNLLIAEISSTNVSKADPSLNNKDDQEIKSTTNSGELKGNNLIPFASKHIVHTSEGEQSYSYDNLNNNEILSKQITFNNSSVSKPQVVKPEVVEEVCTKGNKFRKPKSSVSKKEIDQLLHLSNDTRTRCAAKRKASMIKVVTNNVESISLNVNVKRECILTSNLNDLLTNKKRRIARVSCETEEKKRCSQDSRANESKESVATEFITNGNLVNKEAEKNVNPAKCYLNSRSTRTSFRVQNNNGTILVGDMNARSHRQRKTKSIELKILTDQETISVENKENSTQKRGKKVGKNDLDDKSKCMQESLVFTIDNINADSRPVCELSFASEVKCLKRKKSGSIIESAPSVRSTRSKRGSSPSFSRETILWSPSQRQAMANKQPRVLFTSYKDNKDEKLIINLGGNLVESVNECTVLVTNAVRRTCKFLACLGKGVPIVSTDWLVASKQAGCFVDPWQFLIVDKESEKKFGFNLKSTLTISKKKRLFCGYSIHVTDSVMPPPDQMREIIECAGGEYLEIAPKINAEKILVISCKEDKDSWKRFKKLGLPILHAEFILSGLLKQQIRIKETLLADC